MSVVIVPAAGRSSRFGLSKPKWMLTAPNGNLMLAESLRGVKGISRLIITVVRSHLTESRIDLTLLSGSIAALTGVHPEWVILDTFTSSQAETVYATLNKKNIITPFVIKDCDNQFWIDLSTIGNHNFVCTSIVTKDINATNKSYVDADSNHKIRLIAEKRIISNTFCAGAYGFASAKDFTKAYYGMTANKEIYISNIIDYLIQRRIKFDIMSTMQYVDWGTLEDWNRYKDKYKTIFCDIDGVLVQNASNYFEPKWNDASPINENINQIKNNHYYIVLTTSRPENEREATIEMLKKHGIPFDKLIMGLPHSQRVIINDFAATNPYPSATAINVPRNSTNLKDYMK